ncbi:acyl carrier protein phosphodiesterase [Lysobacter claricitrinus]|uniref:acyl carrier protein phosphodiesterase n=1 Tax=Lysobacter claricitrinus TaxID=3367728 RepID=UPI0037DBBF3F
MNWLAHMHLARQSDAAMLGALLGDFVFGSSGLDAWGDVERREMLLHRRVDRFTDTHPAVTALRAHFPDGRRRYAGIVLDVYFDHLLARDWPRWSDVPLDAFTARAYAMLRARQDELPPRLQAIVPRMAEHDWLGSYRERAHVDRAVARLAHRLSRNGDRLVAALEDFRDIERNAVAMFDDFYAELQAFVTRQRAAAT